MYSTHRQDNAVSSYDCLVHMLTLEAETIALMCDAMAIAGSVFTGIPGSVLVKTVVNCHKLVPGGRMKRKIISICA